VHSIHLAKKDPDLFQCISNADLVLPDGSGLNIAGKVLHKPVKENLNGTDFTPVIFRLAESLGYSVYLLGAKPDVLKKCKSSLRSEYPNLQIAGAHHGYFDSEKEKEIIQDINRKKPDIVLVATGSPRQEKWITDHAHGLNAAVCFAVGGLFDFLSGEMDRAPFWMRKLGIEWAHRFVQNPKDKWNRIFIEIPAFLYLVLVKRAFHSNFYQT
jgi:N-acetylglucosaminyldiphosphoundecaprenol N-acetyl-beta-D-mannosaminyltransferase